MSALKVGEKVVIKSGVHKNERGFISEILFSPERDVMEKGSFMVIVQDCKHAEENIVADGEHLTGTGKIVDLKEIDDIINNADNFTQNSLAYMINHCGATTREKEDTVQFVPT